MPFRLFGVPMPAKVCHGWHSDGYATTEVYSSHCEPWCSVSAPAQCSTVYADFDNALVFPFPVGLV